MSKVDPQEILKKPYARRLTPDESGGYVATIQEFPGCIAEGDSVDEAVRNLEAAAASWLEVAAKFEQPIPEPLDLHGYSGKVALRIPRGLHKQAAEMAASEGASLNQFLTSAIAHYVGSKAAFGEMCSQFVRQVIVGSMNLPAIKVIAGPSFFQLSGPTLQCLSPRAVKDNNIKSGIH
ncbi:MAG: toxin-antitoxin system HicB family antitoxin [Gammaproteobacteria bacterium]|nr:toxin-antitoxin system HicB family antitoxin [Gammaproteobacteria bacterium]